MAMVRPLDNFRRCATSSAGRRWRNHPPPPPPAYLYSQINLVSTASLIPANEHASELADSSLSSARSCRRSWWHGMTLRIKACNAKHFRSARSGTCNAYLGCLHTWERVDAADAIHPPLHKPKSNAAGTKWKLLLRKLRAWMHSSCIVACPAQECPLNEFRYDPASYALNFDDGHYRAPYPTSPSTCT